MQTLGSVSCHKDSPEKECRVIFAWTAAKTPASRQLPTASKQKTLRISWNFVGKNISGYKSEAHAGLKAKR